MDTAFSYMKGYNVSVIRTAIYKGEIVKKVHVTFCVPQAFVEIEPYDFIGDIMSACLRTEHHTADTVGLGIKSKIA